MKQLLVLLAMLLVFPVAVADDGGDKCRNINGHAFFWDFQAPCEFNGIQYDSCYIQKIRGTINGSWVSYLQDEWFFALEDLGVPTPPDAGFSLYNREFEVFTSKQGMVWGEAQFIGDFRYHFVGGGPAVTTIVTGGTGIYEDATGWITPLVIDSAFENFSVHGRVCGPNIEE